VYLHGSLHGPAHRMGFELRRLRGPLHRWMGR
jgi:hypothetical protein